jgi:hypothetical protein
MTYGYGGLGSLHQAPDGTLYQVQNPAPVPLAQDDLTQVLGIGTLGEVRQGPDGNLYQWVHGADGLGNPVGFWNVIPAIAKMAAPLLQNIARPLMQAAQPLLQQAGGILRPLLPGLPGMPPMPGAPTPAAPFLPTPGAPMAPAPMPFYQPGPTADPEDLIGAAPPSEGLDLGALYQAPDGTLYRVEGLGEDEEQVRGLDEEEWIRGLDEEEWIRGLDEDEQYVQGLDEEEWIRGLDEDEQYVQGLDDYVPADDGMRGVDAYVRERPARTRWSRRSSQPPEMWKPMW